MSANNNINLSYRAYIPEDRESLLGYVMGLYIEDHCAEKMNPGKIDSSLSFFREHPDLGEFLMICLNDKVIGYCLLTNYYSNEYGGRMVMIDEFYIDAAFRGQGLGSAFLKKMMIENKRGAVAYQLEVFYGNENALRLYKKLGFQDHKRHHLILEHF
jgi:GNAT superfamily N-acetyltransferase